MPRLIVNADDFGYTTGINRAVIELAGAGALRSATLMAGGDAFVSAVAEARRSHTLGVGCHVVLVDGKPVAPPEQVPTLLDPAREPGEPPRLRPSPAGFARDLTLGRIRTSDIETEALAQISRLQAAGLRVTHLDTHKHMHMLPRVLRPVLRAALGCGVRAVRNPFEPQWAQRATPRAPLVRRLEVHALQAFRAEFLRLTAEAGLRTTAGAIGVLATGTLDAATIRALLCAIPEGDEVWELVCHPGYADPQLAALPTRLQGQREVERASLAETLSSVPGPEQIHFGVL